MHPRNLQLHLAAVVLTINNQSVLSELLLKIFNCHIRVCALSGVIDASQSRAQYFISTNSQAQPDWNIKAAIGNHTKYNVPTQGGFSGESFGDCELDYRWFIFKHDGSEILKIIYQYPNPWATIEAEILNHDVIINYIPGENQTRVVIDPYTFPFSNLLYSQILNHWQGLLVHASGVMDGTDGYIFTAVSGTGKSTMAGLWAQKGSQIINDDIIAITTKDDITIHNIPMPHYTDFPKSAPLKAIFIIKQSPNNYIKPLKGAFAAMLLMANCIQQFGTPEYVRQHLATLSVIASQVPIFEAGFQPNTDIVDLIRHEINR